jgi:hypothetical protein
MARIGAHKPAAWFWVAAVLFTLWGVAGVIAFYGDVSRSESSLAAMSEYDRQLYLARPGWVSWAYGLATWGGLAGGVAMLLRTRLARAAFAISLVAIVAQFGWALGATDLIAVKGLAQAAGFPAFILLMGIVQLVVATMAIRRGWLR